DQVRLVARVGGRRGGVLVLVRRQQVGPGHAGAVPERRSRLLVTSLHTDDRGIVNGAQIPTHRPEELVPQHPVITGAGVVVTADGHRGDRRGRRQRRGRQWLAEAELPLVVRIADHVLHGQRVREIVNEPDRADFGPRAHVVVAEAVVVVARDGRRQRAKVRQAVVRDIVVVLVIEGHGQPGRRSEAQREGGRDSPARIV